MATSADGGFVGSITTTFSYQGQMRDVVTLSISKAELPRISGNMRLNYYWIYNRAARLTARENLQGQSYFSLLLAFSYECEHAAVIQSELTAVGAFVT